MNHPSGRDDFGRLLGHPPVAGHHLRRADPDLADFFARKRHLALDERDASIARGIELNNELETTQDQLADAYAAAEAESAPDASTDTTKIDDHRAEVERLTADVERLTEENESLRAVLAAAEAPPTTIPPATAIAPATTVAPETSTAKTVSPAVSVPASVSEIGEWLASLYRRSVLGQGQRECLGQTVQDEIGDDRLSTIRNADGAGDDQGLVDASRIAAATCGIDPSAICRLTPTCVGPLSVDRTRDRTTPWRERRYFAPPRARR